MAKDTKERILEAALEIFSRDGYEGTNIKDIAESVGIVKSALYRHFESKEDIRNAVIEMMIRYYSERFGTADTLKDIPRTVPELYEMTMRMISFTVNDTKVIQMRKFMLTEQFRDEKVCKLASDYFLYDTEAIFTKVFEEMMNAGSLKKADPAVLAFSYTAPITALIHLCDREPGKKPEALAKMKSFIDQFTAEYGTAQTSGNSCPDGCQTAQAVGNPYQTPEAVGSQTPEADSTHPAPVLQTQRLTLRPFEESDAESVYEYAKDPEVGPVAGWPVHTSVENSREIIKTVLMVPETYAICRKGDAEAIGAIGLMVGGQSNIELAADEGEIGYWLGVPFWGQGMMPEAVRELIRHAFEDLNLKTLYCGYFEGNEKSKRVQEKCGFKHYETHKDIHWKVMDDIRTEHITRLTREDWEQSRAK